VVAESIDLTKKWREQVKPKPNRSSADTFSQPQPVKVTLSPCRLCSHLLPSCPTTPLPRPPAWTGLQVTATSLNSIEISYPQVEAGHIIQRSLATQRSPRKHTHMQGTHQQTSQANARCSCSAAGAGWLELKPPQQPYARNNPRPQPKRTYQASCRRMQTYCSIQPLYYCEELGSYLRVAG
jgi:hypothetical protein